MKKFKSLLALLLAFALLWALAACGGTEDKPSGSSEPAASDTAASAGTPTGGDAASPGSPSPAAESEADHTLTIGITTANGTHDPAANASRLQCGVVFETLMKQDPVTQELVPSLATSWEYLDPLTLEVKLRDDVYFTNGQHFTAKDVLYTLRDLYGELPYMGTLLVAYDWEATQIVDDYTIRFAFNTEYGPTLSYLAGFYMFCYDDLFGDTPADSDAWMYTPNGTGPYYCVENIASAQATYARKDADAYWGELPECTQVTYKYYSETSTMYIDFETGVLDAASGLNTSDSRRVIEGDCPVSTHYDILPIKDVLLIILSDECHYFDDIRVREAFFKAIDRESVSIATYGDLYMAADSILPSEVKYYEPQEVPDYDPDGARALLAQAGYPDGIELKLVVTNDMATMAEALQGSLATGGITLSVESYDMATAITMLRDCQSDFMCKEAMGGAYINEPALLINTSFGPVSAQPLTSMDDEEWLGYYDLAYNHNDDETRAAGYAGMQEWAIREYRIVPLCERATIMVYNTEKLASFVLSCPDEPCPQFAVFQN